MSAENQMTNALIQFIKDMLQRNQQSTGREYGMTSEQIMIELNNFFSQSPPGTIRVNQQHVMHALSTNVFETFNRPDGTIAFRLKNEMFNPMYFDYGMLYQPESQPPPPPPDYDLPMPTRFEDLNKAIEQMKKKKSDLLKRQNHLIRCQYLLQNPVMLEEEVKRVESIFLSLRDMQSMIEDKILNAIRTLSPPQ